MTFEERINDEYFNWLCDLVDTGRFATGVSYYRLLAHLHNIEFTYFIPYDENRADDGIQLRRRFGLVREDLSLSRCLRGPCSVLEMMVALAVRCEETIMDDALIGDRTGQWFWGMIRNLGLNAMTDRHFDRDFIDDAVSRLLNREYAPNGRGGLFTVRNCDYDLRTVEIWGQLSRYLGSIT